MKLPVNENQNSRSLPTEMETRSTLSGDRASEYVQEHARYNGDSPNKPYSVRYPSTAGRALFAADTWDLVEQVSQIMEQERQK